MVPLKFQTSAGLVYGVFIDNPEALKEFKNSPTYIDHPYEEFNNSVFDIEEDLEWFEGMFLPDVNGENTFHKMGYIYARLRVEDMWVKMELDDPHYGDPEWKALHLDDKAELLKVATLSSARVFAGHLVLKHIESKLIEVLKKSRSTRDPYNIFEGRPLPDWIDEDCDECGAELYVEPSGVFSYGDGWICGDCKKEEE